MEIAFRLVDVFAPRPLSGNQLCVVPDQVDLADDGMLSLAREVGLSETTFVSEASGDRYSVRIFTPDEELPFAGHPTIGTAFVLAREGRIKTPATQVVRAGEIPVDVDLASGEAWMTQFPAVFGPVFDDRDLVARAAGLVIEDLVADLPVRTISTGLPPLLVPVKDPETLRRARIDQPLVADACRRSGGAELYLFAMRDGEVWARFFGPTPNIVEDPATGSAAGPLGVYLAEYGLAGMPGALTIRQGEQVGRPSELRVEVERDQETWRARVGGNVFAVGEGVFHLP